MDGGGGGPGAVRSGGGSGLRMMLGGKIRGSRTFTEGVLRVVTVWTNKSKLRRVVVGVRASLDGFMFCWIRRWEWLLLFLLLLLLLLPPP